jgi:hypothetical protein
MTGSGIGARYTVALLALHVEIARGDNGPMGPAQHHGVRRDFETLVEQAGRHAAIETITSMERFTVGLLLRLATVGRTKPEALLEAVGLLRAAQPADGNRTATGSRTVDRGRQADDGTRAADRDHAADAFRDPALALLTIRLDMTPHPGMRRPSGAPAPAPLYDLREELLLEAVRNGPAVTITTMVKIATALIVELAAAFGSTVEDLLARLAPHATDHDG